MPFAAGVCCWFLEVVAGQSWLRFLWVRFPANPGWRLLLAFVGVSYGIKWVASSSTNVLCTVRSEIARPSTLRHHAPFLAVMVAIVSCFPWRHQTK